MHILLNYQRWKSATHVGHKASWDTERPDTTLRHLSMQPSTNSMNFVILHSYQKMVHSTRTKDGQWSAGDILCFQDYSTVMIDVGRLKKGGFAGTPASMCSVLGTVIQGLLICSEWLCLRGGQYLLCNTFIHLIDKRV